jgi:hypothetical protein
VHDAANEGPNQQLQNLNLSLAHLMTFRTILERVNPYVNVFVRVADRLATNPIKEVHICITAGRTQELEMSDVTTFLWQTKLQ